MSELTKEQIQHARDRVDMRLLGLFDLWERHEVETSDEGVVFDFIRVAYQAGYADCANGEPKP